MAKLTLCGYTGVLVAVLFGCSRPHVQLTENDLKLIRETGAPETLVRELLIEGGTLHRLAVESESQGGPPAVLGVSAEVPQRSADETIDRLRKIAPSGYFVFESEKHVSFIGSTVEIAIVRGMGPYDVMRAFGTDGANYGLTTDMVIARLQQWDGRYGLDIRAIDRDSISAAFRRKPPNMLEFAREVYVFCPDVVTQGAQTVEKLADAMDRGNGVYLWWD